ncbi:MAG: hypothetical protein Kow0075_02890 [Salibacteraceae bacterium]
MAAGLFGQTVPDSVLNKKPVSPDKVKRSDVLLIGFNSDRLLGLKKPVKQKWYGRGMDVSLMFDHPLVDGGRFSIAGGIGFATHNYYTNAFAVKIDSINKSTFVPEPDSSIRDKGKISVNYFDIPFELRYRSKPNTKGYSWKLFLGGRVGYLLDAHEKYFNAEGRKFKSYYYPHVSLFRYGVSARVGYGSVMLSAFYSISPFFEAPFALNRYNTLTIGLTIVPF